MERQRCAIGSSRDWNAIDITSDIEIDITDVEEDEERPDVSNELAELQALVDRHNFAEEIDELAQMIHRHQGHNDERYDDAMA